jgi:hypothetical protein
MMARTTATACLVAGVALLTACAGVTTETAPREGVVALLRSLNEAKGKGEVGSVEGHLFLLMPGVPTPLKDWPVTLIPLSPSLEAAVAEARERYERNGRAPLAAEALARAREPIQASLKEAADLGHGDLIRTAKTGTQEPKFTFQEVPQGRWLLVAELPSKVSMLLWASPVTVSTGQVTRQPLNDSTIWLEGLSR